MINEDLARRAMASKHWRWLPGMLAADTGLRLDEMTDDWEAEVPDLDDPATLGCLLALVREAWDDRYVYLEPADSGGPVGWLVMMGWIPETATVCSDGSTEAAALVAALEAAP